MPPTEKQECAAYLMRRETLSYEDETLQTACHGEADWEVEGKHYCLMHAPTADKAEEFEKARQEKLAAKDYNFLGAWFPADVYFGKHNFESEVNFNDVKFNGYANFHRAQFSGGYAYFQGAQFGGEGVNFRKAQFSGGSAVFRKAQFSGWKTDFSEAQFTGGYADFYEVQFTGEGADFHGTQFSGGDAYFNEVQFGGWANFEKAQFGGSADFDKAQFTGGNVGFNEAKFSGGFANFGEVLFSGGNAGFSEAHFSGGSANFGEVLFSGGNADFQSAQFSGGNANFNRAQFSGGNATFNDAQFSGGPALFLHTRFSGGQADFYNAQFSGGDAYFYEAQFSRENTSFALAQFSGGNAYFNGAQFDRAAYFFDAHFSKNANFENAVFAEKISFAKSVFEKQAFFDRAEFKESADFCLARFSDFTRFMELKIGEGTEFYFGEATFERPERVHFHSIKTLCARWFINLDTRKFNFENVEFPDLRRRSPAEILDLLKRGAVLEILKYASAEKELKATEDLIERFKKKEYGKRASEASDEVKEPPHKLLITAYQRLATNAEENNRYEEAMRFRYLTMETQRRSARWQRFLPVTLHWWYWASSGYGERAWRAGAMLFLVWLVPFLFYVSPAAVFTRVETKRDAEVRGAAEYHVSTDYPAMPPGEAVMYSLNTMAFQKPEPRAAKSSSLTQWVIFAQTVLGPLQAALLALAIRRKFMR